MGARMPDPTPYSTELKAIAAILTTLAPLDVSQREFVLRTVADRLAIPTPDLSQASREPGEGAAARPKHTVARGTMPKSFLAAKNPESEVERVACLAYFLTHSRNTPHFKTNDIVAINTEAAAPRLAAARRTLDNAMRRSRFLAPAGYGSKQISAFGEKVVEAMPDRDAVAVLLKAGKKATRRKAARKPARTKK
jgi:hypothetical protein